MIISGTYLLGHQPTLVGRIVVGGFVFLTGAPACCRFAVHLRSYDCPFTVFVILLSQCVVNIILTTIGNCAERNCQQHGSLREQFTPHCKGGSGAHPLQVDFRRWQQDCGAVIKMTQHRSSSFHTLGSGFGPLGFHQCGSGSGALLFHGSGYQFLFVLTHWCFQLSWCAPSWMENDLNQVHKTKRIYQTFLNNLIWYSFLQAALLPWATQRKNKNHRFRRFR